MAIFIPGMRCLISGRPIESADKAVAFPAFIANEADPLHIFRTLLCMSKFFLNPLAARAQARYKEAQQRTALSRLCFVCGGLVIDPEDYLGLGYLIDDRNHPVHRFNYVHFHRPCLAGWPGLPALTA